MLFVLCDDHRMFVEPLGAALAARGHEVVVTTTPDRAVAAAEEHEPDLVLTDLRFPVGSGLDVVARLRERDRPCPVVVLSASVDARDQLAVTRAGAAAFLRKDQPMGAVFAAIDRVLAGRTPAATPRPPAPAGSGERARVRRLVAQLTPRERQVLALLVEGQDTAAIARSLGVSPGTTRTHLQNVLLKLGVHNRLQAVALVVGAGVDAALAASGPPDTDA